MKVQKRPRSSISARRTACFSVSSSSRYMSLTSCSALSSWGCRSPFPAGVGRTGRAGDAGLDGCTHGLGPCAGSVFSCGVGDKGAREHGAGSKACGGAGPTRAGREDGQTDGQTDTHSNTKLHSHPGSGVGLPTERPTGGLYSSGCFHWPSILALTSGGGGGGGGDG